MPTKHVPKVLSSTESPLPHKPPLGQARAMERMAEGLRKALES